MHINIDPNAEQGLDDLKQAFEDKPSEPYLFAPDGKLKPGETVADLQNRLGPLEQKLGNVSEKLIEGDGQTQTTVTFHPAMVAAKKMEKKIHDQLQESGASTHLRSMAFEMALLGTGVMKGPFAVDKEYPNWGDDGNYDPLFKTIPQVNHVSVWNFYADPDANNMDEAQFVIERHKMSRSQLRQLKKRPYFRSQVIDEVISFGENYTKKYWEDDLSDYAPEHGVDRFEVLEYWGMVDTDILEDQNVEIPEELKDFDELQANFQKGKFFLNPELKKIKGVWLRFINNGTLEEITTKLTFLHLLEKVQDNL